MEIGKSAAIPSRLPSSIFANPRASETRTQQNGLESAKVSISSAAKSAFLLSRAESTESTSVDSQNIVDAKLSEIKSRDALHRSQEDTDYLLANDKELVAINNKALEKRTASEIDYVQKAVGFVNTFSTLSPAEKALYDKAIASGNEQAAAGISQIALIRFGGEVAGGQNGTTYNPKTTEITVANIQKYFSQSIVDTDGKSKLAFDSLIQFLQKNTAEA